MKFRGPVAKRSRALGIPLSDKAQRFMDRRPYGPGMHGPTRRSGKMSDYAVQLREKQRLRYQYNVHEGQMRRYYKKAAAMPGNTGDNLIRLLEQRLDALVYRSGLAVSIYASRQHVVHGHITVNGKRVDRPSYQVQVGDTIGIRPKSKDKPIFKDITWTDRQSPPPYVQRDEGAVTATLSNRPEREDIPVICDVPYVVEFYSR